MFIGMLINGYRKPGKATAPGVKFAAKKILKFAIIILLGASLNVTTILNVDRMSPTVMFFTLLTCFGGYFMGRAVGLSDMSHGL